MGFPGGSVVKNLLVNEGNMGSTPGLGQSPRGGNGNPLQYSCQENPMERGAWQAKIHGHKRGHNLAIHQQQPEYQMYSNQLSENQKRLNSLES